MRALFGVLVLGLVFLASTPPNVLGQAGTVCATRDCAFPVGATCIMLGAYPAVYIQYGPTGLNGGSMTLIVFDVVRNSANQTVLTSTATMILSASSGASDSAYPVVYGLPHGNYSETLFADATIGTTVSPNTSLNCTL
jgi:hypothetical protein